MHRRTVLKKSMFGLGAYYLSPLASLVANRTTEKKLGIALVGLGNYATNALAPALQYTEHCYLAGIVTGTPAKEVKWAKEYGIKKENIYNYKNYDQIKDNPDIDIIYIVLPNFMHKEYTIRAFEAGKHVICEKPMGMDSKECKEMLAAQQKAGKKLQVGYRLFYEPNHLAVKQIGANKQWGKIKMMEAGLGFRMGRPNIWRMDIAKGGGGAIMDLGVYCTQALRRFAGELPAYATAQGYNTEPSLFKTIYETITFQLEFPSGFMGTTTTSFNAYVDRFHAACEDGWLEIQPAYNGGQKPIVTFNPERKKPEANYAYQQVAQMDAFAKNIIENTEVIASGEEGLIDMQIIDAVKQAVESGQKIRIEY